MKHKLFKIALSETHKYAQLMHTAADRLAYTDVSRAIRESAQFRGIRSPDVQTLAEQVVAHLHESVMSEIDLAIRDAQEDGLDDITIARELAEKYGMRLPDAQRFVAQWVADNQAESVTEATSALAQWKQKVKAAHPTATFEVRKKTDRYGSDRVEANVGDRMVGYFEKKSGRSNVLEAQSMGGALRNALSKAEPGSKLDHKIKTHNRAVKNGLDIGKMTAAPDGYHFDKKGYIRLGESVNEAAEKSIKVYHVDRNGKEGYTVVDSAAALQDHIKGLKRSGAKITHTASIVNGQEGPAVYPKAAQVDEALNKHSFLGRIQRHQQLKKKVDQTWQDAVDAEKRGDEKAKNRSFEKHVRYTNLERPGTWTKVKEELDDQLASFAPGDRVRVMNARRYDSMAPSNEVEGEVIFVFPDGTVAVAIGTGQSNVDPQDLVKLGANEAADAETTTNYDNMSDWENHANRLGCQIRKDNKTGTLHAYLNGDHCGEYFTHGKLQGTGRIVEKATQMNESFPYDVDHMPGRTLKYQSNNCTTCHGRQYMYRLGGKLYADNKKGATKIKCPTCKGTGSKPVGENFSGAVAETSFKVGDKIRTIKMGQTPGVIEKIDGDWVIFRHESGKLYRAPASNVRLDESLSGRPFNQFGPQPKQRQTAQQKAIAQRNKADFNDRYGKRGEAVMYTTAAKRAMSEDSDEEYQQGLQSAIEILRRANQEYQRTGDRSVLDRAHREYGRVYDKLLAANPEAHSRHAAKRQVWGPAGTNESAGSVIDSYAYNNLMDQVPDTIKRRYGIDAVARAAERAVDGRQDAATVQDVLQWLKHDEESRSEAEDWHELQRLPRNRPPRGRW